MLMLLNARCRSSHTLLKVRARFQAYRVFAELTGQSLNTIRFCEPVATTDFALIREEPALVRPRVVYLVSHLYDYRVMQLRDLSVASPVVAPPPYNGLPPPHFLLGYQYMHRVLNDYLFDNRVFMQIGYDSPYGQRPSRLYWSCLTDCSYGVNVGQYMRFLDLDNFHGTFQQMHNAVLMDRVAADVQRARLRGTGAVPNPHHTDPNHLTGRGAVDLQDDVLMRVSSATDASLLATIRRLRVALCHFLYCYHWGLFDRENIYRFLPFSEIYDEDNWLDLFVEAFADLDTQMLLERVRRANPSAFGEPEEIMTRCLLSSLATDVNDLIGGAIDLRNRRVSSRRGLRPRDARGRAITSSRMRQTRRRVVQRFVDRLPVTRRRRRSPLEREEEREIPQEEEPSPPEEEEEDHEDVFFQEILQTALEAVRALQDELSGTARRHDLFRFGTDFYRLLLHSRESGMISESMLRKWVLYFFLAEHIASTLFYLHSHFVTNREFRRYVDVNTLQVLITGWSLDAQPIFKRIWSEQSNPATIFETLWERILRDFLMMVERTGQFEGMDEADQQIFLSDIQYRDKSGDVEEVLKQLNLSEELIDSIDISFRIKFHGIVVVSTNERIRQNLRRVLEDRRPQRPVR